MNPPGARTYSSPLRAEQAAATRRRVLDAAIDLMRETDSGDVAMPDVAERAGVSASTAYRAFANRDELLDAVLDELKARFESAAGPRPETVEGLVESTGGAVRAVFEVEDLFRALFATPAGRELHRRTAPQRSAAIDDVLRDALSDLAPDQVRRFVALAHLVISSRSVLFLKDYEGLGVDDAVRAIHWGLEVLVDAARDPERRAEL